MVDEATASDDMSWPDGSDPEVVGVIFGYVVLVGRVQAACRPRAGRETSRISAKRREPVINQNGRPEAVSGCLRRSAVWGASIWGTEGREFKSPQPDKKRIADQSRSLEAGPAGFVFALQVLLHVLAFVHLRGHSSSDQMKGGTFG